MTLTTEQVKALQKIILEESHESEELKKLTDQEWAVLANGIAGYYLCLFDMSLNKKE